MKRDRWVAIAVAMALIAASLMFSREVFLPEGPHADEAAVMGYVANESYQAFLTLGVDAATRNVLRAFADVVRGKYVEGAYPSEGVRLRVLTLAHEVAHNFERGVSNYALVDPRARERVSEADFLAGTAAHRAEYAEMMRRTIFDEFGTRKEVADAECAGMASAKEGVRWSLALRCG